MRFLKGHGTGNDFVVLPDPDGALDLTPDLVRALCDRRFGIGGDGVLRAVRRDDRWFMDYRNSDGSIAEMCGNGARVFARYLAAAEGLGPKLSFDTRAGVSEAVVEGETIAVAMRRPVLRGRGSARLGQLTLTGEAVDVGNPHLVCRVPDVSLVDLSVAPVFDPELFPHGVNVEVVSDDGRMRVYERGSGETLSCGTGACAVAAVLLEGGLGTQAIDVPGGRVTVTVESERCWLAGPAVLVASGDASIDEMLAARPL
jgi:diaminopimelate epimerase